MKNAWKFLLATLLSPLYRRCQLYYCYWKWISWTVTRGASKYASILLPMRIMMLFSYLHYETSSVALLTLCHCVCRCRSSMFFSFFFFFSYRIAIFILVDSEISSVQNVTWMAILFIFVQWMARDKDDDGSAICGMYTCDTHESNKPFHFFFFLLLLFTGASVYLRHVMCRFNDGSSS